MNYNISECNFKSFVIGSGWPEYKNILIKEMADFMPDVTEEPLNTPRYDTMPGVSRVTAPDNSDANPRDAGLMKELYSQLNKTMLPYVLRVMDEYEYVGSPIYDEEGIDRETLAQLVSRVIALANEENDEAQEISLENVNVPGWNRRKIFDSLIQSLVLNEIFMVRRPRYRRARGNYIYSGGRYDGVNPQ